MNSKNQEILSELNSSDQSQKSEYSDFDLESECQSELVFQEENIHLNFKVEVTKEVSIQTSAMIDPKNEQLKDEIQEKNQIIKSLEKMVNQKWLEGIKNAEYYKEIIERQREMIEQSKEKQRKEVRELS